MLAACEVPLVFVSDAVSQDVRQLQCELGVFAPFICGRGAELHIPRDTEPGVGADDHGWEQHRFTPPAVPTAVAWLREVLSARRGSDVLMVGLGCQADDYGLLAAVDIPIVVRQDDADQAALLRLLPNVYITRSTGGAGWSEALLGSPLQ
jgi:hypothetical protein